MRTFNPAFEDALINADSVDVRFTIEVQWDDAGTELVYFLSHADSGAPTGATTIHSIHSISSTSQALNNRYAIAEIGALHFALADVGDAITTELSSRFSSDITPVKKKCTVYMGSKDLDWADYEPVDTWFIDDVDHTGPGYNFRASDVQRLLRQKIFTPDKSRLSAAMTATQTHIPLTLALSSTKFPAVDHDSNYTFNPSASVGYVKIDDEIVAHDGTFFNHGTDGPSLGVVTRGALNTRAAAHTTDASADEDNGKEVVEIIYIEGNVVDVIHLVMTGENVSGADTIPDHWNAGMDTAFVDSASFTSINSELADRRLRFIGEKEQDAKQFIEQQCMRFYGLFQTVTSQGKLKLHRYERTIAEASPAAYIDDDTNLTDIGLLSQRSQDIINFYDINYNWDYLGERHTRGLKFLDSSSYNANGSLIKKESFEFRGVHTALHSDNDIRNFIYQTRELYSNAPFRTQVKANRKLLGVEVGDVVNVETQVRKDYVSGVTTLNRSFLVNRRIVDLNSGEVSLELVGSSLKTKAILDPGAAGSTGELTTAFLTGTGTNLESLPEVSNGTITTDLTLTGTSDINAAGSIWYLDGNLVVPTGVTLTLGVNVQLRVTGQIDIQAGATITGKGGGHAGIAAGGATVSGYFGTSRAGVSAEYRDDFGTVYFPADADVPVVPGKVNAVPFFNLVNTDGVLTGLPGDLRGTPGGPGGGNDAGTASGGAGGASGTGFVTISRGMSISPTANIDLSGDDGTQGDTFTDTDSKGTYGGGSITLRAGSGAGGLPGVWLVVVDGDYTAPTFERFTADRGAAPDYNLAVGVEPGPYDGGFEAASFAAVAARVQYVPAQKSVADTGETGIRQLSTVTGVSATSGESTLLIHDNGNVQERVKVSWSQVNDSAVAGYQVQAKRSADPDWITVAITDGVDDLVAYFDVEDGTQYDIRVRALPDERNVVVSDWSTTLQHTAVGASDLTAISAPANVSVTSGLATILVLSDNSTVNRMKVTWDASADPLWTATEIEFKKDADSTWQTHQVVESSNVTETFIPAEAGVLYDVRLRHLSRTRPNSSYTSTTHTVTTVSAITAPANVSVNSGTAQLKTLSDGSIIERMLVTWDASGDQYWTATEVEFKKASDSAWDSAGLIQSSNVTQIFIEGEGGTDYDIRLRHLSNAKPASSYTTVSGHTLVGEDQPPSDVTNFKASQNGELVNFTYDLIGDADRNGYIIRFGVSGISWEDATPLTEETKGTKITSAYVPPGAWDFLIKAIDRSKNVSTNAARTSLTVVNGFDIVSEVDHEPGWKTGTVSGYWVHYTGKLVPLSQNTANTDGVFSQVVRNPVATSTYTSDEQDGSVQARMRIWANIDSVLASGETGIANPQLSVDYRDDGGSYDGFEDWTIEQVTARYAKFKITNDNANDGVAIIRGLKTVVDAQERKESAKNVTVAPGGTAITFDDQFRQTPFISVFPEGGGGLIADSAGDSSTGFTFHLYDSSGTSAGGTGKWVAEGI